MELSILISNFNINYTSPLEIRKILKEELKKILVSNLGVNYSDKLIKSNVTLDYFFEVGSVLNFKSDFINGFFIF